MQERHQNRRLYFEELALTSRKFFIPYLSTYMQITPQSSVLEIGCGDGGNLLPFAELGCRVTGVDIDRNKIEHARGFFAEMGVEAELIDADIFTVKELEGTFDLIIIHDVIEHIEEKQRFIADTKRYLKPDGLLFIGFPAWQMPFGGHQQICRGKFTSHMPFIHLLPKTLYSSLLKACGEREDTIRELLDIKSSGTSIELFLRLIKQSGYKIEDRKLYFINPHYQTKFGLRPRLLAGPIAAIPHLRNYFTTSCLFLLKRDQ